MEGGADEDEDLTLVEGDLVPTLLLGLPRSRARLDSQAVPGGEGRTSVQVALTFGTVGEGEVSGWVAVSVLGN